MTSRERMRNFYAGAPIDRVPNGLGGCETAGMHMLAYENLKKVLGVNDPTNRMCTFMCNAVFERSVLDAMDGDMILLNSKMCPAPFRGPLAEGRWKNQELWGVTVQVPKEWTFSKDADGTIWWGKHVKCPPGSIYFDGVPTGDSSSELPDMDNQPSPEGYVAPHVLTDEYLRELEEVARWVYETTDYSIVIGETIQDLQDHVGGGTAWWMRMVSEPEACHHFLGVAVDEALKQLERVHQAVGKYCDAMILADDIGDVRGVTCGPDLWRSIYKPHYKRLWTEWHKITNMKSMLHSCGSVVDILGDFIECGLDIFNPIQISARGMDPERLSEKFGQNLIFYGGALDAVVTPPWTPDEEVYEQAKKVITTFARGGRYIFGGTHNIPGDTPPGHLQAIIQAYRDCREDPELNKGLN